MELRWRVACDDFSFPPNPNGWWIDDVSIVTRTWSSIVPVTVSGELRAGFEIGTHKERNQAELAAFLHSRRVAVVPVTEATTLRYATIYAFLRGIGRPIPTNDLWIAAAAMEHSVALLTADHHFHAVPHILLEFIPADS